MSRYRGEGGTWRRLPWALCLVLVMTLGFWRIAPCSTAQRPVRSRPWMPPGRRAWMPVKQPPRNTATMQALPCRPDRGSGQGARGGRGSERVVLRGARSGSRRKRADVGGGHAGGGGESPSVCRKLRPRCEGCFEPVFSARVRTRRSKFGGLMPRYMRRAPFRRWLRCRSGSVLGDKRA